MDHLPIEQRDQLLQHSSWARSKMIEMSEPGKIYHFGGALSVIDILTYLYCYRLNGVDFRQTDRDKVILSKGHSCQALYTVFARVGLISEETLSTYKKSESLLQGHPDMKRLDCIDFSTGSMGQGLSAGVGMAIGYKMKNLNYTVHVILGDGEIQEGQIWEAAMAASKYKLDNLVVYIDYNKLQVDGFVVQVMPVEPLRDKWESFGWFVQEVNGHNFSELHQSYSRSTNVIGKPKIIIAHTIKGKGVEFMENAREWHSNTLNDDQKQRASNDVRVASYETN